MKYNIIIFLIISFSSINVWANSSKYRGGEIKIKKIDNNICIYIEKYNLKGDYELNIFEKKNFYKVAHYSSSFEKKYPLESDCIKIKNDFNKDKIYTAVLDSEQTNFGGDFCFIHYEIGKFNGNECIKSKYSFWDKLKIFF